MNRKIDYLFGVPFVKVLGMFSTKPQQKPKAPKKILVIKLAAMGDTILLIPVLRSLRKAFPEAQIHWLLSPINQSLAQTVPYVDRFWNLKSFSFSNVLKLVLRLRRQKYDTVVDFEQWARGTAILSFLTGAPTRIGYDTPGQARAALFTHPYPKNYKDHEMYDFFNLLNPLPPFKRESHLELNETETGKAEVSNLYQKGLPIKEGGIRVLIHPGCGKDGLPREWPLPSYALIAHWLIKKFDATIFITAGPEETKKASDLKRLLKKQGEDLGGRLSWQGTVSLVKQMDVVLSGNTGVMHVAAALGKNQVALHGPTNSDIWGPINSKAIVVQSSCDQCPCLKLGFEYHQLTQKCMEKIDPNEVKNALSTLIDKAKRI